MSISIFVVLFLLIQTSFGQSNSYSGKTFINDNLDQIDFIDDSVLVASFRASPEKYEFKKDSLVLTLTHHHADMEFRHSYKLLQLSHDTLSFIYTSLYNRPDTVRFINVDNRIVRVKDFDFLRVDMYGWNGFKRLIIKKDRTVKLGENEEVMPNEEYNKYAYFKLTDKQYQEFLEKLSKYLVLMLPPKRADGGEDITDVDFTIRTNGKTIISKGSTLSKIHNKLLEYLFSNIRKPL